MRTATKISLVLLFVLILFPSPARPWQGKVVKVLTGDTIIVNKGGKDTRVKLYGIECPERGQPIYEWATNLTSSFVLQKMVDVVPVGSVRYDTVNALVRVVGKRDLVNGLLVHYGMAWVTGSNCIYEQCKDWMKVEEMARINRVGLWMQANPVPPWEWRKQRRRDMLKHEDKQPAN